MKPTLQKQAQKDASIVPHNNDLVVERLSKSWGAHPVFSNISFIQPRGTIFGFKGENGSGKSTLLKIIAGIVPADEGEVRFESETQKNRMRWSSLWLRSKLALDERFTVRETLLLGGGAGGFPRNERKRWVTIAEQDPLISSFLSRKSANAQVEWRAGAACWSDS